MDAMRARRSIGKLDGDVDEALIRTLLEAAVLAPNHRLTEPWRFTVVRGEARERMGAIWAEASGSESEARKPLRAPVLIAVSVRTDADAVIAEEDFAATAAAVENLLLAATAHGLGAIWRTGAMVARPEIKAFLELEESDRIVAIVYLGQPAMDAPPAKPRQFESVVRWLS